MDLKLEDTKLRARNGEENGTEIRYEEREGLAEKNRSRRPREVSRSVAHGQSMCRSIRPRMSVALKWALSTSLPEFGVPHSSNYALAMASAHDGRGSRPA